ncbi:MAG: hypothetical protein NTNFB01_23870 [Nitrospira sp.]
MADCDIGPIELWGYQAIVISDAMVNGRDKFYVGVCLGRSLSFGGK